MNILQVFNAYPLIPQFFPGSRAALTPSHMELLNMHRLDLRLPNSRQVWCSRVQHRTFEPV